MSSSEEYRSSTDLIKSAQHRGTLSPASAAALQAKKVAGQVDLALEKSYTLESAARILLITLMPDDSGSIETGRHRKPIKAGHNELLAALASSDDANHVMLQTRYLNGTLLNPFRPLSVCKRLTKKNYICNKGTPLLFQTLVTLGTVMAKTEELLELGARVRTATLIMTDAQSTEDNASDLKREVASVVNDMRKIGDHIVAGMGFARPGNEDFFRQVFTEMSISPNHIFTATSREEILTAFRVFRQSALALTAGVSMEPRVFEG